MKIVANLAFSLWLSSTATHAFAPLSPPAPAFGVVSEMSNTRLHAGSQGEDLQTRIFSSLAASALVVTSLTTAVPPVDAAAPVPAPVVQTSKVATKSATKPAPAAPKLAPEEAAVVAAKKQLTGITGQVGDLQKTVKSTKAADLKASSVLEKADRLAKQAKTSYLDANDKYVEAKAKGLKNVEVYAEKVVKTKEALVAAEKQLKIDSDARKETARQVSASEALLKNAEKQKDKAQKSLDQATKNLKVYEKRQAEKAKELKKQQEIAQKKAKEAEKKAKEAKKKKEEQLKKELAKAREKAKQKEKSIRELEGRVKELEKDQKKLKDLKTPGTVSAEEKRILAEIEKLQKK